MAKLFGHAATQSAEHTQPNRSLRNISRIGMLLSGVGLADSLYLTIAHYTTPAILACSATKFVNCEKVTTSSYSLVAGIPLALIGVIYFTAMLYLQLPSSWRQQRPAFTRLRLGLSIAGMGSVFYLVYVEIYRLNALCLYCTGVHILTFGLFVLNVIATSLLSTKPSVTSDNIM